ncbi:transglycosylase SLT domain-containing protein [Sphingomonas flavalba]|uniref:lytic transglycosylase domain-containing protein n=1 Tax=Sphingomonas flavalba TaxID=2559804 RepID=UPI0039E080FF
MVMRVPLMALLLATPAPLALQPIRAQPTAAATATVGPAIIEWNRLRQTDSLPFSSYAGFLIAHPGWPGEAAMRRTAERVLAPETMEPRQTAAFFDRFAPLTNTGQARYAEALAAIGRQDEARAAARKAWTSGSLSTADEARMLTAFGGSFTPADQDERMDRLLWAGATSAATRQLPLVTIARRPLFEARLAMRTRAADAATRANAVLPAALGDAGYLADRALWLRATGQAGAARQLLAQRRPLTARPSEPVKWYETLLTVAQDARSGGQPQLAWDIARQIDDAFPPGTDFRNQPLAVRDRYTSLAWLAGMTALSDLRRPADAIGLFQRYAAAAKTPQTQTKGYYWAGQAAKAAGNNPAAHFEQAGAFADQFYGQLALEALGRPLRPPPDMPADRPSQGERQAFMNREVVRAARYLGQTGNWRDQTLFVRAIAESVDSGVDHVLADELSRTIGRPDLAVMVGRAARSDGRSDYARISYPQVPVPSDSAHAWTMVHAIARQESQFDRDIVSRAGARGLMQLMPATAAETARKLGIAHDPSALSDTGYNIRLGAAYFHRMLDYYGGSHVLAVAAYNAGPGNVNRWLKANGDPRTADVDTIRWIESIPFSETRNYVQRVLENAVVYELLNPQRARTASAASLSAYLGTRPAG